MNTEAELVRVQMSEPDLIQRALEGDKRAANKILNYLSASDANLRRIMLKVIQQTADERIWWRLLHCLALKRWNEALDCERRRDPQASARIDKSIVEAFTQDLDSSQTQTKEDLLRQHLQNGDMKVRHAAAYLLALRGHHEVIQILEEAVEKGEKIWQLRAVEALSALHDKRCGPSLIKALANKDEDLHKAARRALNEMNHLAFPAWLQALGHPDAHIRWHAARGLGQIGDIRAVQVLAQGLRDDNHAVRWSSARVLGRLDDAAVPAILTVLSRNRITEPFRQAAYHALNSMASRRTRQRLQPLLEALRSPAASVAAPAVAQRLLAEW